MKPVPGPLRVVAALVPSADGLRFLVQQRPAGVRRPLLWEFPGGKVEAGESDAQALRREVREELGVELEVGPERFQVRHRYPDLEVDLHVYAARVVAGTPRADGAHVLREATVDEMLALPFCEADRPLIELLAREASEAQGRLGV